MSVTEAYARLAVAQKGRGRGAPAYSLYVNRPAGRLLAASAFTWGLTPNQITAISALCTFSGILLLMLVAPTVLLGAVVWLLLAAGYAWDSADGQVARLRGGGSLAGEWLDHVVDATKLVSLHIAVAIAAFRFFGLPSGAVLVPLGFAVIATVAFFGMILNDLLRARAGIPQAAEVGGSTLARSLLGLPVDYGVLCLAFVLWGFPFAFMCVYTLLALASLLHLAAALPVWFLRMKAIG